MGKNIIVGQSGGPTAVINASLYGVIKEGVSRFDKVDTVYGMVNGIQGFIADTVVNLSNFAKGWDFELLKTTPGAFLSSCRFKLPEDFNDPTYEQIFDQLKKYDIGYFFYIGGNDSMDTVSKLSRYASEHNIEGITFVGVPKTVDDDLIITDHTPGFGSAAKYVANSIREIAIDSQVYDNKQTITLIEVMGRHAGWLTAASILARTEGISSPHLVYLPETDFDVDKCIMQIKEAFKKHNNVVVALSEGIHDKDGKLICEYSRKEVAVDSFGHKALSGTAVTLQNLLSESFPGIKMRAIELSVSQRASAKCLSATDNAEAINAGRYAVDWALKGMSGVMVAFIRKDTDHYEISYEPVDVNKVCNAEKSFPLEWIIDDDSNISDDALEYFAPLIKGDVPVPQKEDGLPAFAIRTKYFSK